jgi:two-component system sensor histidine kinase/response regulator
MQADRERCLQAGMNAVVTKPIHADALWQALLNWIRVRDGLGSAAVSVTPEPKPAADPALLAGLRHITQLDVAQGLLHTRDQAALYTSLLRKFVAAQADAAMRVQQCLAAGDRAAAELIAHTLKSVSANLGALRLQDSAGRLETALRQGATQPHTAAALTETQTLLDVLVQALRQTPGLLPERTAHDATVSDAERQLGSELLLQLKSFLLQDDATALEFWETHAGLLRALLPQWRPLETAIKAFAFDSALALLGAAPD